MGAGLGEIQNLDLWLRYMLATKNAAILSLAFTPGFAASQPKMNVFKVVSKELFTRQALVNITATATAPHCLPYTSAGGSFLPLIADGNMSRASASTAAAQHPHANPPSSVVQPE